MPAERRSREGALRREFDTLQHEWPALVGWRLVINDRMRSVFGRCHFGRRTLYLAGWHVEHGEWTDVLDTLLRRHAHTSCRTRLAPATSASKRCASATATRGVQDLDGPAAVEPVGVRVGPVQHGPPPVVLLHTQHLHGLEAPQPASG